MRAISIGEVRLAAGMGGDRKSSQRRSIASHAIRIRRHAASLFEGVCPPRAVTHEDDVICWHASHGALNVN